MNLKRSHTLTFAMLLTICAATGSAQAPVIRYSFRVDSSTPVKQLLPAPRIAKYSAQPAIVEDLAEVPEITLGTSNWMHATTADQIAKINFLNDKKADHFMEVLLENRTDLAGLPFVLGAACRLEKTDVENFAPAVKNVREAMRHLPRRGGFWKNVRAPEDRHAVAALMQMTAVDSLLAPGLIEHLAQCDKPDATQALARIAIFSEGDWSRRLALAALQKRETGPASEILRQGLRYPWPAVAKNTAEAVVQLRRADLEPELARMLNEPDPRAPTLKEVNGKRVAVVRELVRINHVKNCLLCHPPGNTADVVRAGSVTEANLFLDQSVGVLVGEVPISGEQSPAWAKREIRTDNLVRADATYLRQDFSRLQKSGSDMQRLDFLVRNRILTDAEAPAYHAHFAAHEQTSPYRELASRALRDLRAIRAPKALPWTVPFGAAVVLMTSSLIACYSRRKARLRTSAAAASLS